MNIMTKRGQMDNIVTYQYYCDTANDLQDIPQQHTTLGSVAIVLSGSDGGLQIYIANSNKQWNQLTSIGGSGGGSNIDLSNYLLKSDIAAWAKAENKPKYTASEVNAMPAAPYPEESGRYILCLDKRNGDSAFRWMKVDPAHILERG